MSKNDFYIGIGFIGMILSIGFHTCNYEVKSVLGLKLFLESDPLLFVCFVFSVLLILWCIRQNKKNK